LPFTHNDKLIVIPSNKKALIYFVLIDVICHCIERIKRDLMDYISDYRVVGISGDLSTVDL